MKNILRYLALVVGIVLGIYLMLTVFLVFALLALLGFFVWLYIRYIGKSSDVVSSSEGVTIEHESVDENYEKTEKIIILNIKETKD